MGPLGVMGAPSVRWAMDRGRNSTGGGADFICPEVLDTQVDALRASADVLAALDAVELHQLRLAAEEAKIGGHPRFRCPLCLQPLGLRGGPGGGETAAGDRGRTVSLHFAHPRDPEHRCPYKTDGDFTPEQYQAMKYNGLKETRAHRLVKARLWAGLRREPMVVPESLKVERRYRGKLPDTTWRQPDVQACWRGMDLVFEAQLATTFVTVIAQRRTFYRRNGAQLIWVFASPPGADLRFTTKDVVFNNNCNLFVVSAQTAALSVQRGCLMLEAWWPVAEDRLDGGDRFRWNSDMVTLDQLTFDESNGTVYYADHDAELDTARARRNEVARLETLRRSGDHRVPPGSSGTLFLETTSHPAEGPDIDLGDTAAVHGWLTAAAKAFDGDLFDGLLLACQARGLAARLGPADEERRARHFEAAVCALLSLKAGAPIGTRLANLRAIENWIWDAHRSYYTLFVNAVSIWRREQQLHVREPTSTFMTHVAALKEGRRERSGFDPAYRQDTSLHPILRVAFPELGQAMDRIEAAAARRSP